MHQFFPYSSFKKDFVLETDSSIEGWVQQDDKNLHPVALLVAHYLELNGTTASGSWRCWPLLGP